MTGDSNSTGTSPSIYTEYRKGSNSKDIEITFGGLGSYENDRPTRNELHKKRSEKYNKLHKERSKKYDETYGDDNSYEEINTDFQQEAKTFFNNPKIKELCIKNEALQEELLNHFKQADSLTEPAYLTCSVLQSLLDTLTSPGLSYDIANNLEKRAKRRVEYIRNYTNLYIEIDTDFKQAVLDFFTNDTIRTLCINDDKLQKKLLDNFKQADSLTDLICGISQSLDPPDRIYYEKDLPSFFFGLCRNTPEESSVQQEGSSVQQRTPEGGSVQQEGGSVQQDTPERGYSQKFMELSEQLREAVLNWVGYKGYKTAKQENEDMLKFIREKIEGKEDVCITSWSWGNYDALTVVRMALERGKNVHWKILSVANEYLLGWEYYNGKESFLTELGNFLSEIDNKPNATGYKDRLHIDVRDQQTQDPPSRSCDPVKIIQKLLDGCYHPERDMEKLRKIVGENLLDKNSNSANAKPPSGDTVKLCEVVGHSSSNNPTRITNSPKCRSVSGDKGEVCNSVDDDVGSISI